MLDEGYVKYDSHWTAAPAPHPGAAEYLDTWRRPLFEAGLIGHYDELGIGYGNISMRCGSPGQFLISGTQTGHIAATNEQHYSLVTAYDLERNSVDCAGPLQASSEAMTHAAIYELDDRIGAVVHGHSLALWRSLRNELPATAAEVAYGTPAMAREFARLYADTGFRDSGIAVMAGHEEGLISFGHTLEEAAMRMLSLDLPAAREPG